VPGGRIVRHQMNTRLDHHRSPALGVEGTFDGAENFLVGQRQAFYIRAVEIGQMDGGQMSGLP
jgi:hypothetical protein